MRRSSGPGSNKTAIALVNMYGTTETTVHVTYKPLEAAEVSKR